MGKSLGHTERNRTTTSKPSRVPKQLVAPQTPGIDRLNEVRQYELVTNVPENLDENVRKWLPTMRSYRNKVIYLVLFGLYMPATHDLEVWPPNDVMVFIRMHFMKYLRGKEAPK